MTLYPQTSVRPRRAFSVAQSCARRTIGTHGARRLRGQRRRGVGHERRREELVDERVPVVVAGREDLRDALHLRVGREAGAAVRPRAELQRPRRLELRVGRDLLRRGSRGSGPRLPTTLSNRNVPGDGGLRRDPAACCSSCVRLRAEVARHRVEAPMALEARGFAACAGSSPGAFFDRDRVGAVERLPQPDDHRLVDGRARLIADVGRVLREERGRREVADARLVERQRAARAIADEIEEARLLRLARRPG